MRRSRATVVTTVALSGLIAGLMASSTPGTALARDATPAACDVPPAALQRAMAARTSNGFRDDAAYVTTLLCGGDSGPSRIGTPITPSEEQELARRDVVGSRLAAINTKQLELTPNGYVNSWVDTAAGGVATFAFLPGTRPDVSSIAGDLPPDTPIALVDGLVPLKIQLARTSAIQDGFTKLWSDGVKILASNTSHKTGVLEVYVSPDSAAGAESTLLDLFGAEGVQINRTDPATLGAGPQDAEPGGDP